MATTFKSFLSNRVSRLTGFTGFKLPEKKTTAKPKVKKRSDRGRRKQALRDYANQAIRMQRQTGIGRLTGHQLTLYQRELARYERDEISKPPKAVDFLRK